MKLFKIKQGTDCQVRRINEKWFTTKTKKENVFAVEEIVVDPIKEYNIAASESPFVPNMDMFYYVFRNQTGWEIRVQTYNVEVMC